MTVCILMYAAVVTEKARPWFPVVPMPVLSNAADYEQSFSSIDSGVSLVDDAFGCAAPLSCTPMFMHFFMRVVSTNMMRIGRMLVQCRCKRARGARSAKHDEICTHSVMCTDFLHSSETRALGISRIWAYKKTRQRRRETVHSKSLPRTQHTLLHSPSRMLYRYKSTSAYDSLTSADTHGPRQSAAKHCVHDRLAG